MSGDSRITETKGRPEPSKSHHGPSQHTPSHSPHLQKGSASSIPTIKVSNHSGKRGDSGRKVGNSSGGKGDVKEGDEEEEVEFEPDEVSTKPENTVEELRQMAQIARLHTKYDFVKVKVWLEDHYYVLSRFIVSRVLTMTKIPTEHAIKIALDLKKDLVDQGLLSISQVDLEKHLFKIMADNGYAEIFRDRFVMTLQFHHQRVPLIVIIAGTGCMGKSFFATQLAERINVPNVLQTNLVYEFIDSMRPKPEVGDDQLPLLYRRFDSKRELLQEFRRECQIVRDAVETDLEKALKEGKSIILEGFHIDPALYVDLIERHSVIPYPKTQRKRSISGLGPELSATEEQPPSKDDPKGVIIPIIFNMKEKDHRLFVENWLSCSIHDRQFAKSLSEDAQAQTSALLSNLRYIQSYLCSYAPPFHKLEVKAQSFPDTLDHLHGLVIETIQQAYDTTDKFADLSKGLAAKEKEKDKEKKKDKDKEKKQAGGSVDKKKDEKKKEKEKARPNGEEQNQGQVDSAASGQVKEGGE